MFNQRRLLFRNLIYHWRGNLAVLLGVAVGAAVLTGALMVGDSLRGSLRTLTANRLGWIDHALVANRFFRDSLADAMPADHTTAALFLRGTAELEPGSAQRVAVLGVDECFWHAHTDHEDDHHHGDHDHARREHDDMIEKQPPDPASIWDNARPEGAINESLARALHVKQGDKITLFVQTAASIPRESLLGRRKLEDAVKSVKITIRAVLPDQGIGGFAVRLTSESPANVFVPLRFLQQHLELEGQANALLVGPADPTLQKDMETQLTLADWGLRLRTPEDRGRALVKYLDPRNDDGKLRRTRWAERVPEELAKAADADGFLTQDQIIAYYRKHRPYFSLESRQMYLEPAVVESAIAAAHGNRLRVATTTVYLADSIADANNNKLPYAVVAALPLTEKAPLGPFFSKPLAADEILLTDWSDSPLTAEAGDKVTLSYYAPDEQNRLILKNENFTVRAKIPLQGPADDPDLTPEFPGITDKLDMAAWENPPFPYFPDRIKNVDEKFWKRYKTTPKAYISPHTAERLWSSRFGNVTSIRMATANTTATKEIAGLFEADLRRRLNPEQGGFVFRAVKQQGMEAGAGSTDFGVLFLLFSFFLIVSALLLVGLLVRLNTERRAAEVGVLLASGFRRSKLRWLLIGEGALLAVGGGLIGLGGAVIYAGALLEYLKSRWPGGPISLDLYVTPLSLAIGYFAGVVVSVLTIIWALRILGRVSPRGLMAGETSGQPAATVQQRGRLSQALIALCALGAGGCLIGGFFVTGHEAKAGTFFGSGALLLIALLLAASRWLRSTGDAHAAAGFGSVARLGVRNAARQPVRSLLTLGLLASATFLLVAVQIFHRQADETFHDLHGGSGGFRLYAEPTVPVFQDLNDSDVREQMLAEIEDDLLRNRPELRGQAEKVDEIIEQHERALKATRITALRVRTGDDASCLNLYRPLQPQILGVPKSLIERGGFHFSAGLWESAAEQNNPWLLLQREQKDGAIPIFADANSAMWILKIGLGDVIDVRDGRGTPHKLRLAGLLQGSIFQSELLMADANFKQLYPREEGFRFFLIDCRPETEQEVRAALQMALADHGFIATKTAVRLQRFLDVENTYLATFQALGAFGLLLGALGLAVVLLRSVWERRAELALMRALGFRRLTLGWLVLAENAWLLLLGLLIGAVSALLAVTPHLLETGAIAWDQLALILGGVLVIGLLAGAAAVAATLRAPLLPALRRE